MIVFALSVVQDQHTAGPQQLETFANTVAPGTAVDEDEIELRAPQRSREPDIRCHQLGLVLRARIPPIDFGFGVRATRQGAVRRDVVEPKAWVVKVGADPFGPFGIMLDADPLLYEGAAGKKALRAASAPPFEAAGRCKGVEDCQHQHLRLLDRIYPNL